MPYKFITSKKDTEAICFQNMPIDAGRVWDNIRLATPCRVSKLMISYSNNPMEPVGVAYYHYFPSYGICCIEYITADSDQQAKDLLKEVQRRVYMLGRVERISYLRLERRGVPAGISNESLHMYNMWCRAAGVESLRVSSCYAKVHAHTIMQLLYSMYKWAWGTFDPWVRHDFSRAIEELILGPAKYPREDA